MARDVNYGFNTLEQQSSSASTTTYATDAQGLYKDPNPEVVRRPAPGGTQTYTQRVSVRFLQPPPVSPPGVSILFKRYCTRVMTNVCILTCKF